MAKCRLIYWQTENICMRFLCFFVYAKNAINANLEADVTSYVNAVARVEIFVRKYCICRR